jgi:hypothetical protein
MGRRGVLLDTCFHTEEDNVFFQKVKISNELHAVITENVEAVRTYIQQQDRRKLHRN